MNVFVLWRAAEPGSGIDRLQPDRVARRLGAIFGPLFDRPPEASSWEFPGCALARIHLPMTGLATSTVADDGETWAFAPQPPVNAAEVVGEICPAPEILPRVCRGLDRSPAPTLARLAPPFSLVWTGPDGGVRVQTDGLGHALLYEYRDSRIWALTDRPMALGALGVTLRPEPLEWAVRASIGWFPMRMTGFQGLSYSAPGARYRVAAGGITEERYDVLGGWISDPPEGDPVDACVEGLLSYVRASGRLVDHPVASLSGGRDSRVVASLLVASGVPFTAKVRGPDGHPDVVAARLVAEAGGFDITQADGASMPPDDAGECMRRIDGALRWQAGGRSAHRHKTFQWNGPFHAGGSVGATGQHGEIGRSTYLATIRRRGLPADRPEESLVTLLMRKRPRFIRAELAGPVEDVVRASILQADAYGLRGVAALDFMYLFERTRRWAAVAQASTPGVSIAPFLTPAYIRASYGSASLDKTQDPFHAAVVERLTPGWVGIPFAADLPVPPRETAAEAWKVQGQRRFYDTRAWWSEVGRSAMEDLVAGDGFWSDVFDPDRARAEWETEPDELAVVCRLPDALAEVAALASE